MTNRQMFSLSIGGALIFLVVLAYGVSTIHETCHDFNQATVMIDNKPYSVALAVQDTEKTRGLIGCQSVPNKSGMYFVYNQLSDVTYWMRGMSIPIDIVWIARGQVVGIEHNLPTAPEGAVDPPLYKPAQPVDGVLEIGAGKAVEYGIKEGAIVTLLSK